MMNKTPKLLPWLARQAGISIEKATTLWRDAMSDESLQASCLHDPDRFYRTLVERLQGLAVTEKPAGKPVASAQPSLLSLGRQGDGHAAMLLNSFGLKPA